MVGKMFTTLAIGGNILFILWMLFNGIDEGFKGATPRQIVMYGVLAGLLLLNSILLVKKWKK